MPTLLPSSPVPLYAQIAELLRGRIARGIWAEGDRLPSLDALTREFEVARVTVRQAIIMLEREGILAARQGRGTFVTARPGVERRLPVQSTLADLVAMLQGSRPRLLNIEERKAAPRLTGQDGKPADHYVYMRRVHLHDDVPYCVISIYLDERIFRMAPKRFRQEVMIPILTTLPDVQIATAHQTLTIGTADSEAARRLGIAVNAPVAEVRRVFRAPDGTVIYLGEVTYRGDLIQIEMDLTP
jgi:GntR family transcriptional regulator